MFKKKMKMCNMWAMCVGYGILKETFLINNKYINYKL